MEKIKKIYPVAVVLVILYFITITSVLSLKVMNLEKQNNDLQSRLVTIDESVQSLDESQYIQDNNDIQYIIDNHLEEYNYIINHLKHLYYQHSTAMIPLPDWTTLDDYGKGIPVGVDGDGITDSGYYMAFIGMPVYTIGTKKSFTVRAICHVSDFIYTFIEGEKPYHTAYELN